MTKMSCFGLNKDKKNVLYICKERKRLLKLAVERREAFAAAQCKYNNAHYTVAKSLRLFVARQSSHSSSPSPGTDPPTSKNPHNNDKNKTFLKLNLKESATETNSCQPTKDKQTPEPNTQEDRKKKGVMVAEWEVVVGGGGSEDEDDDDDQVCCDYYRDEMPPVVEKGESSSRGEYLDPYNYMRGSLGMNSLESEMRARQVGGIPELEEVEDLFLNATKFESVYRSVVSHMGAGFSEVKVEVSSKATQEIVGETSRKGAKKKNNPKNMRVGGVKIDENKGSKGKEIVKNDCERGGVSDDEVKMENNDASVSSGEPQDLPATGAITNKELMLALEEIEALFIKAYEAGLEVSKMMEATKLQLRTGLTENSNSIFWAIVRNRSSSLPHCSSCKSVSPSISHINSLSTGTVPNSDNALDFGGMMSGSHSMSMGKLYEWEKKLYEDVKMGETTRKQYEKQCAILLRKEERDRGEGFHIADRRKLKVKSLDANISVSLESAASISNRIIKVRDEELEPQLFELLQGLMNMWKIISKSHETQSRIMFDVALVYSLNAKYCCHFHRHAILELEAELKKWCACFSDYVSAQKAYVRALDAWFSTCNLGLEPDLVDESGGSSSSVPPCGIDCGPAVVAVCHEWMVAMEKLPDMAVMTAMKSFRKEIKAMSVQQRKEQRQKKKVDGLIRELDRKVSALLKAENKILKLKESKREIDGDIQDKIEYLDYKKNSLEGFKQKVELEKAKHNSGVGEIQRATLSGFQTGFSQVFESLVGFSKATVKMYEDLVTYIENVKATTGENSDSSSS